MLQYEAGMPGVRLSVDADLRLYQRSLWPVTGVRTVSSAPFLERSAVTRGGDPYLSLDRLLTDARARNESLLLDPIFPFWSSLPIRSTSNPNPSTPGNTPAPFVLQLRIRVPPQTVMYRPALAHVLKHGWVQYFALFCLVGGFLYPLYTAFVVNQVIPTAVRIEGESIKRSAPWKRAPEPM